MQVKFHPEAKGEFTKSALFYESRIHGLGFRFIDTVNFHINRLEQYPRIGQIIDNGFRRLTLKTFPYSLIYSIEPDSIWIMAVAHQHRKPGFWQERHVYD